MTAADETPIEEITHQPEAGQLTAVEWQRLEQIRAYVAAATAGPWTWEDWQVTGMLPSEGPNRHTLTSPPETRTPMPHGMKPTFPDLRNKIIGDEDEGADLREEDKVFIASIRTDAPWLLDLVNRLATWLSSEQGRAEGCWQALQDARPKA